MCMFFSVWIGSVQLTPNIVQISGYPVPWKTYFQILLHYWECTHSAHDSGSLFGGGGGVAAAMVIVVLWWRSGVRGIVVLPWSFSRGGGGSMVLVPCWRCRSGSAVVVLLWWKLWW